MSKQVIMMVVDAGNSMDEMYSDFASRLKLSLQCIQISLQQKIFNNVKHEIGLAIFGDNEVINSPTDDNYFVLTPPDEPNVQLIRQISLLSSAKLGNEKPGGDIFRAISSSIDVLLQKSKSPKGIKKIFLFTNGMGKTQYDEYHIKEQLAPRIKQLDIKINIIPINFMEGYNIAENQVESQIKFQEQLTNALLLMYLKKQAPDNIMIIPDDIAIDLYRMFRKRDVNPVVTFKGQMEIGPDLSVDVQTFKMVRRERLKSLQKYDLNQPFNPKLTKEKEIILENTYIVQGDETNTPIPSQNQTNAYQYGPHLIPISRILETEAKWQENRNLKLLGFVAKRQIAREAMMGEVELVVPTKGVEHRAGQKLFTALVYSMLSLEKYAIARYVPRNSKIGVIPRLVVLIPFRNSEKEGLYLVDLPTVEDVRTYPYTSLKPSTDEQRLLVKQMISMMSLYQVVDNEGKEMVKTDSTFNPTRQYFFQSVFHRVKKPDDDLPPLDPYIKEYLSPELRFFDDTAGLMPQIRKEFKLTKKELSKERAAKKQQALFWKDVVDNEGRPTDHSLTNSEIGSQEIMKPNKFFDGSDDINEFNPLEPLISFSRMLNNNKVDLVDKALKAMQNHIINKSNNIVVSDTLIMQMLQCASELRRGCDEQQQKEKWDLFLDRCKTDVPPKLFQKMVKEGLGYLLKPNKQLIPKVTTLHKLQQKEEVVDLD